MAASSIQGIQGLLGSAGATQSSNSAAQAGPAGAMDSTAFMQMFLTQLKFQDPTNPLESYQLAAQLAQFSTLQEVTQTATTLENLQSYALATNNAEMAS